METREAEWRAYEQAHPIIVPDLLSQPHPITVRTAAMMNFTLPLAPAETASGSADAFAVSVGPASAERALRIVDTLVKACEQSGFEWRRVDDMHAHTGVSVLFEGESIPLELVEQGSAVKQLVLRIKRGFPSYPNSARRTWKDTPRRRLETQLNGIMLNLRIHAAAHRLYRERLEERQRREEDILQQRDALRERVEQEQEAVEDLFAEAKDWRRAQTLRAYVAAVEALPVLRGQQMKHAAWVSWARDQADRLDPLTVSPPSILDTPYDAYREPGWEEYIDEDGNIAHA